MKNDEAKKRDRANQPSDAVAITTEMIEAGKAELLDYQPGFSFPDETIRRIWAAMMGSRDLTAE